MIKKLAVIVTTAMILSLLAMSCTTPTLTPVTTPEPEIPAHFSTYTSEGLFSISYPPDWAPATSVMEEALEIAKEWMQTVDPELAVEEVQVLFIGGIPTEGYVPGVNIVIIPRSIGYWTLDEIVEGEGQWARENLQRYHEYSQIRTTVDGREAVISDWESDEPYIGMYRYLQLFTVKDNFLWLVTCGGESEDFRGYEDTFYSIAKSLRILN